MHQIIFIYEIVTLNTEELPAIEISDRTWNDDNIAATLELTVPPEVQNDS